MTPRHSSSSEEQPQLAFGTERQLPPSSNPMSGKIAARSENVYSRNSAWQGHESTLAAIMHPSLTLGSARRIPAAKSGAKMPNFSHCAVETPPVSPPTPEALPLPSRGISDPRSPTCALEFPKFPRSPRSEEISAQVGSSASPEPVVVVELLSSPPPSPPESSHSENSSISVRTRKSGRKRQAVQPSKQAAPATQAWHARGTHASHTCDFFLVRKNSQVRAFFFARSASLRKARCASRARLARRCPVSARIFVFQQCQYLTN